MMGKYKNAPNSTSNDYSLITEMSGSLFLDEYTLLGPFTIEKRNAIFKDNIVPKSE